MTTTQRAGTGAAGEAEPRGAAATLERARDHLLGLQDGQGWWKGELETNVTMDAEDLLLREFLGIRTERETEAAGRWIRSQQRGDGTWTNFYGGPPDLSTTVEAYVALRLAGDPPDVPHMARAATFIRDRGGVPATRVFTRIWLAMFGEWPWDDLPVMPPELIYLPSWFPLNVYDWACWARQTIVPLTIVGSLRPVRTLPFTLAELGVQAPRPGVSEGGPAGLAELSEGEPTMVLNGSRGVARPRKGRSGGSAVGWAEFFRGLDRVLHAYERGPVRTAPARAVRRAALRRCAEWIIARQEADGCWGGIQPPWVYSLIALHVLGYGLDHPVMRRGLAGLERFVTIEDSADGPVRRLEACQSPVWDTVLAMIALADAGLPAGHPALAQATRWVLAEEIPGPGDWQVRRPRLAPGGWAFEFDNDIYPDIDDTAVAVVALARAVPEQADGQAEQTGDVSAGGNTGSGPFIGDAVRRALRWLEGMQSRDGGWGAFDADNTQQLCLKLPFCDFGAVIDPPSADVTAHVVEALSVKGLGATRAARRGVAWLLRAQEPDGSWFGRWGANYVYGTGAVLPALIAAGVKPGKPTIRRAVAWLESHQNPDGGWGEDLRSYDDPALAGQGESTASQTAWALIGLLAASPEARTTDAVGRGVQWLIDHQTGDGTWDEPRFTGTGFPGDFYINYHLYRLIFPVSALGRYLRGGA